MKNSEKATITPEVQSFIIKAREEKLRSLVAGLTDEECELAIKFILKLKADRKRNSEDDSYDETRI